MAAFNEGRFADALAAFRKARRGAAAAQARVLAAHCLASLGRTAQAEEAFRAAAAAAPGEAGALVGLSELLRREGRLEEAEAAARQAAARAKSAPDARRALRAVLRSREISRRAKAAPRPAPAATRRPRRPKRDPLERARALEVLGRWPQARALYRAQLARKPRSRRALVGLAHALAAQGRGAQALALLRQAAAAPDSGGPDRERFQDAMRAGDYEAAFAAAERLAAAGPKASELRGFWNPWQWDSVPDAASFRRFHRSRLDAWIAAHPRSPWGYFYRGSLTEGPERVADFERALRAGAGAPRYRWMALEAGWAHLGRSARAVTLLRRAASGRPADWWAHGFLAEALLLARRPREAAASMNRAVARSGRERAGARAWRGELRLWLGDYAGALADLRLARRGAPPFARTWEAAALHMLGRSREALAVLDRTLARYPRDAEAYVWRGEVLRVLGRSRAALKDLSRPPVRFWARVNRALALLALGRRAQAREDLAELSRALPGPGGRALAEASGPPGAAERALEGLLARARGYRRDDYVRSSWLSTGRPRAKGL